MEVHEVSRSELPRTRRSPKDIGDGDLAYKSTLTVAVDAPTARATKEIATREGTTVSAVVRSALLRALEEMPTK